MIAVLRAVVAALISALLGSVAPMSAWAAEAAQSQPDHAYDAPVYDQNVSDTATEHGPPAARVQLGLSVGQPTIHHGLLGDSARPDVTITLTHTTYNHPRPLAHTVADAATTGGGVRAPDGALSSPAPSFVAAKTAPKALNASSRVAPWAGPPLSRLSRKGEVMYRVYGGGADKAGIVAHPHQSSVLRRRPTRSGTAPGKRRTLRLESHTPWRCPHAGRYSGLGLRSARRLATSPAIRPHSVVELRQGSATPMTVWFSVHDGRLRVSRDCPSFEWEGLLDGLPVLDLIALSSGTAAVVLLDPPAGHAAVGNLLGVGSDAHVSWRAELPTTGQSDAFVSIELTEDGLIAASTWSGYRVLISPDTGAVIGQEFTK